MSEERRNYNTNGRSEEEEEHYGMDVKEERTMASSPAGRQAVSCTSHLHYL
jgi:hypothetical protein